MDTTRPAPTLAELRGRVVIAFADLPAPAFDQALVWLVPNGRPLRVDQLNGPTMAAFRRAVADYFAAAAPPPPPPSPRAVGQ